MAQEIQPKNEQPASHSELEAVQAASHDHEEWRAHS